jgi:trimeric autotransporter adhesin
MKTSLHNIFAVILFSSSIFLGGMATAQISLLRDINNGASTSGSFPSNLTALGGFVYYSAFDGVTGTELWRSDGTVAGTTQVKDINPGDGSSSPTFFTLVGSYIYFRADDGENGSELWRTDGTNAGTVMVADINPGINSSSPNMFTFINSTTLYFTANNGTNGNELWKTNITTLATSMVADINPGTNNSSPQYITFVSGTTVYFSADDGSTGRELWSSDGGGVTTRIRDINTGAGSSFPSYLTLLGTKVLFAASDAAGDNELYSTEGALANTLLVSNINAAGSSYPQYLIAMGANVYFSADDGTGTWGNEVWRSDGTGANTFIVSDLSGVAPFGNSSYPSNFAVIGSNLYFTATSNNNGTELYRTTGAVGAQVLININPATNGSSYPSALNVVGGNTLYFQAEDGTNGYELWRYSNATLTLSPAVNILSGAGSSYPSGFTLLGSTVFFSADNGSGTELYTISTSGTTATQVVDLIVGTGASSPTNFVYNGAGVTYFSADDGSTGRELWKTNGVPSDIGGLTSRVKDINLSGSSNPSNLTMVGTTLYFTANDGTDTELWRSDGTDAGTVQLDINESVVGASSSPSQLFALNSTTLLFSANDGVNGIELWSCVNGGSPTLVENINVTPAVNANSSPSAFKIFGSFAYYQANDGVNGAELWRISTTTPNAANNSLFANINAAAANSSPTNLFPVSTTFLYFAANNGTGLELWRTDGSAAPTLVKDINVTTGTAGSSPFPVAVIGNILFFNANDGVTGNELWKSEIATPANTSLIKDINTVATSNNGSATLNSPLVNVVFTGKLFFLAYNVANGYEMWSSDGTNAGTLLFKDINPGPGWGVFSYPTISGSSLFFLSSDGTGSTVLVTDGVRSCATVPVPGFSGAQTSSASLLTSIGTKMIFSMVAQGYDREPFLLDPALVTLAANTAVNTHPATQTITTGSPVTFTVAATGTALTYQWQKNSINISGATNASFNIPAVAATDAAQYRCIVTGTCGVVNSNQATLTVRDAEPAAQPTANVFSNPTINSLTVSFTAAAGPPTGYIVIRNINDPTADLPVDGNTYAAGNTIGTSTVAYVGTDVTFTDMGLATNTIYFYRIYSFNGASNTLNYLTTPGLAGDKSTLVAEPTAQPTALAFSNVTTNSLTGTFTAASPVPAGYIAIRRKGVAPTGIPADGTSYSVGNAVGDASVAYVGTVLTFNDTGLDGESTYHYQVFSFNGTGAAINYLTTPPLSNSQLMQGTPPQITIDPTVPTTTGSLVALKVVASVVENESSIATVKIEHRSISSGDVFSAPVDMTLNAGKYEFTLPASANGELGPEYKITATNSIGLSSNVTGKATISYTGDGMNIPYDKFGVTEISYRIISIPLALDPKTLPAVLGDDLGTLKKDSWRMFSYTTDYSELTAGSSIEIGKGYWLIAKTQTTLDTGPGTTAPATQTFSIPLAAGWNLIGNPYTFNVLWSDVLTASGLPATTKLITYDGAYNLSGDTKLDKFEGAFVNVISATDLKFPVKKNPAAGRVASPQAAKRLNSIDEPNWEVIIELKKDGRVLGLGGVGMNETASLSEDHFDGFTVPRFMDYLELNHNKRFLGSAYAKDIVPTQAQHEWDFSVESSDDGTVTLEWDNSYFGNNETHLVLWDVSGQQAVDMKRSNRLSTKGEKSRSFKVFYGNEKFIKNKTAINTLLVHSLVPNPTRSQTTIGFTVPGAEDAQVQINVLNIMGQPVASVFNGILPGGYNEIIWDGKDHSNSKPSLGMYLVEVRAKSQTRLAKLIIHE